MQPPAKRLPQNAAGPYYVDDSCIYCALCVEISPSLFAMIGDHEWAVVHRQPTTDKERAEADEAIHACPMASIHFEE